MLSELGDAIVVAGPNGSGKSCIFDAIRLLKSAYGGYQVNEFDQWWSEFQINLQQSPAEAQALLQDKSQPMRVEAVITLTPDERQFLGDNSDELVREMLWRHVEPGGRRGGLALPSAAQQRTHGKEIDRRVGEALPQLRKELEQSEYRVRFTLYPTGRAEITPSVVLEHVFSLYQPHNVGVIDYHGPYRNYAREQIGGINLNIEEDERRLQQHALYNLSNKYLNLKSQIAAQYVRTLLGEKAGVRSKDEMLLGDTLTELFATFFPNKKFAGVIPTPDGRLLFPVETPTGTHDINELSPGEKEVLYGYLRLRNSAPRNSVLLIDEPELHLNPRLIRGLATFYYRHLAKALGNQLWLLTHSDTLLRDAVNQPGFRVFHMRTPNAKAKTEDQAIPVVARGDLEAALIEIVGDLAGYQPHAKVVILEGGGDSDFDEGVIRNLFPEFQQAVNLISGGNKTKVQTLHALLENVQSKTNLPAEFFSICDRDSDPAVEGRNRRALTWDRYHIENYLLEPKFVLAVSQNVTGGKCSVNTEESVAKLLAECARETLKGLVTHMLQQSANDRLLRAITLRVNPNAEKIAEEMSRAVAAAEEAIRKEVAKEMKPEQLLERADQLQVGFEKDLKSGKWVETFRGRDVLQRFVDRAKLSIKYTAFRNLIVAAMRDARFQPVGMQAVIESISPSTREPGS